MVWARGDASRSRVCVPGDFDNDREGYAVADAARLRDRLGVRLPA
jgi:hypothetical protein